MRKRFRPPIRWYRNKKKKNMIKKPEFVGNFSYLAKNEKTWKKYWFLNRIKMY